MGPADYLSRSRSRSRPSVELKHSPESLQPRKSGNGRGVREKRKGVEWIEKGQGKGREGQRIREGKGDKRI